MPLYVGKTTEVKKKCHQILMKSARFVRGNYGFKVSVNNILNSMNWRRSEDMITESTAKFIHQVIQTEKPRIICKFIRTQRSQSTSSISLKHHPRTDRFSRTLINQSYKIYNTIPQELRKLNPTKFKAQLKKAKGQLLQVGVG